ncbi:efflux RND transporter periplasmic adaptor subunit [Acidobacteria bacterium AH-259-O06]|nr:efflux RND transporter periplasmic adaptor subunit [Acidobacteria bacterium AH-259-O06]
MIGLKRRFLFTSCLLGFGIASAQTDSTVSTDVVEVVGKMLEKTTVLPGELVPFQTVEIHAKVTGFVESISVDRGSWVKKGQLLATMTAPELEAQRAEAQAHIPGIQAQRTEVQAKLAGAESTYQRLKEASKTPGVVAGNDVILAEKAVEALRAAVDALDKSIAAAEAAVHSIEEIEKYLQITAPFDGVITDRYAHVGTLVGPVTGGERMPLVRIEQIDHLRLVVPVPEANIGSIFKGTKVGFTVPAYPGETFHGVVVRPAHSIDLKTRTMPVELDVNNSSGRLAPGMYVEVIWPMRRRKPTLFVPPSAIRVTTERIFVIRVTNGMAEWVDVRRGESEGNLIEVFGNLKVGDAVVQAATDEIRPGTRVQPRP